MKGFRTIGFNMVVALVVAPLLRWLTAKGVDLGGYTPEQLTMELLVNGNVLLRCITDSPVGKTAKQDLAALGPALYEQFMREFRARNATPHAPTTER
jgi:uncharacterized membrane protein (DUF441 family)